MSQPSPVHWIRRNGVRSLVCVCTLGGAPVTRTLSGMEAVSAFGLKRIKVLASNLPEVL